MREKRVLRFWCDHCNKGGGSRFHMARHEKHCTNNPDRACRMCDRIGEVTKPVAELQDAIRSGGLKGLREAANGCPACMLAANRQWPWGDRWDFTLLTENEADGLQFQFKQECETFWSEVREMEGPQW